jgi:hypothetical protein
MIVKEFEYHDEDLYKDLGAPTNLMTLYCRKYSNGALAFKVETEFGEPVAVLSTNITQYAHTLRAGEFFVAAHMLHLLRPIMEAAGCFEPVAERKPVPMGFSSAYVWRITVPLPRG